MLDCSHLEVHQADAFCGNEHSSPPLGTEWTQISQGIETLNGSGVSEEASLRNQNSHGAVQTSSSLGIPCVLCDVQTELKQAHIIPAPALHLL